MSKEQHWPREPLVFGTVENRATGERHRGLFVRSYGDDYYSVALDAEINRAYSSKHFFLDVIPVSIVPTETLDELRNLDTNAGTEIQRVATKIVQQYRAYGLGDL